MGQVSDEWSQLNRQAESAFSRDGYSYAEDLWRQALPLADQLGEDDERYIKTLTGVCRALIMQKKDWDVVPWLERSLEIHKKYWEWNSEAVARITLRLAKTYRENGMPVESENMFKTALAVHTKVYGAADSYTVEVLSAYAELLTELHREDEAQHMMYCAFGYMGGEWRAVGQHPQDVPPQSDDEQEYQNQEPKDQTGFGRIVNKRQ